MAIAVIAIVLAFVGGFALGFWVRAHISARRREAARLERLRAREKRKGAYPVMLAPDDGQPDMASKEEVTHSD